MYIHEKGNPTHGERKRKITENYTKAKHWQKKSVLGDHFLLWVQI